MTSQQRQKSLLFAHVVEKTQKGAPFCSELEMKRPRLNLSDFWAHLIGNFGFSTEVEIEACKILWKMTHRDIKVSKNLMYKIQTVCLILAQKLIEDEIHTLQTYSLISGISMRDLKILELEVLMLLEFNLKATDKELQGFDIWIP